MTLYTRDTNNILGVVKMDPTIIECKLEVSISTGTIKLSGTEDFIKSYKNDLLNFLKENYVTGKVDDIKSIDGTKKASLDIDMGDNDTNTPNELDIYSPILQIDSENNIILLTDVPGRNKSEKAREIAKIVLYIRSKIEKKHVRISGSELIPLCKRHGCYDATNYSKAFENQKDFLKVGKEKSQNWTLELNFSGEQAAKKLLEDMLNAVN